MKLGLESFSSRNSNLDPVGVLQLAAELGLQGVLFELSPFRSFADAELARIRQTAESQNLYLHFGMGSIFHWHPMAEKGRNLLAAAGYDANVSEAKTVVQHLEIARKLGSPILRCVGGNLFVRDEGHDMRELADRAVAILHEACKAAEDLGLKIAMENHADFTVRELLSIADRVESPAFGFTVDTGNLAFDLDDPVRLAGILAPRTLCTHLKNYRILRTPKGLALGNGPLEEGEIDLVSIVRLLGRHNPEIYLNIEIHSQWPLFSLDILDASFFTRHVPPPGDGLAWYLKQAWEKPILREIPDALPDGPTTWAIERGHLEQSIRWAREKLSPPLES
jgi:sugar phosphate isomerase/epimerase